MAQRTVRVNQRQGERDLTQDPRKLRWRRHVAGLTVKQLADKAGVSQSSISFWENGKRSADVVSLTALACALECDRRDLMPAEPGTKADVA
jgi:transcriptional regulator with XRE-family HTH domain